MEFYTSSKEKRPVRLSEKTRLFAFESLGHKYGLDTMKNYSVQFDSDEIYASSCEIGKYDMAIEKIAKTSPVRICDGELISGAATLAASIHHAVPASVGGVCTFSGVSHLTVDFETVLSIGINGIKKDVMRSLESHREGRARRFLESCLSCIDSFDLWRERYVKELSGRAGYEKNTEMLKKVPFAPAQSFHEAVQSIWFTFAFLRLCGNWPGFGRLDVLLGDYLKRDLESGVIDLDTAREILAHFFIKGCEWVCGGDYGSGDAQHYQNIVISGTDENGNDVTNAVTYLILDIIEETGISDFPTTVRVNAKTDEKLMRRVCEVIRYGGGVVAVYGEDTVKKAMVGYGYSAEAASRFANDGCWEVQVPGETFFTYCPFDALKILQQKTLDGYSGKVLFSSYEELYEKFVSDLADQIDSITDQHLKNFDKTNEDPSTWEHKENYPCTLVSIFEKGCIEKAKSYSEGGPVYNVISPHIGGIVDVVNSLYVIKKLVFDEKKLSLEEFLKVLYDNWAGNEHLRRYVQTKYKLYGNDNDESDAIYSAVTEDFSRLCLRTCGRTPFMYPAGVSTFGRQIEWACNRSACPHGRLRSEILSGNTSPTPGSDTAGASAIIKSYCKADLTKMVTGSALDIHLFPSSVSGEEGLSALSSLIRGFEKLGGFFMQIDVVDAEILKEAKKHPENFGSMSVRVSGWNARFVTLNEEWQDMIIERDTK